MFLIYSRFFLFRTLGEFQEELFYDSIKDEETKRIFATIILVSLIVFGFITMINLFIAVIIDDLKDLQNETYTQNLINMAHAAITAEAALPERFLQRFMTNDRITLCLHDLCPKEICKKKVPENFKQIIADIKEKIAKNCFSVMKDEDKKKNSLNENNNSSKEKFDFSLNQFNNSFMA